ncbi:Peptidyl-prolyl cis-trans isomerase pin4 [Sarracenia purpurea var. burkii]
MYGELSGSFMIQVFFLQCIVWYTMLFLFEFRAAKMLMREKFSDTVVSIVSLKVDSDVVSLDDHDVLEIASEIGDDGMLHVTIKKSNLSRSTLGSSWIFLLSRGAFRHRQSPTRDHPIETTGLGQFSPEVEDDENHDLLKRVDDDELEVHNIWIGGGYGVEEEEGKSEGGEESIDAGALVNDEDLPPMDKAVGQDNGEVDYRKISF